MYLISFTHSLVEMDMTSLAKQSSVRVDLRATNYRRWRGGNCILAIFPMCYWYRLVVVVWGWLCQGAPARAWWGVEEGVVLLYWIKGVFLYWVVYCGEWWSACTVDSPAAHTDNNGPVTHPILVQVTWTFLGSSYPISDL